MHPSKRVFQAYHYDYLESPTKYGIIIQKHRSKKETPYLIVTQNRESKLSKRQKLLLEQLALNAPKKDAGVLVLLHGKNGRKEDLLPVAERYVALGFTCLLLDLPYHGESKLKTLYYTTKEHEQNYVDEVLEDASHYIKIDNLAMWGMSLGGAFAIANVAHSKHKFHAMVLVATFDSFEKVLKAKSVAIFGEVLGTLLYKALEKSLAIFYDFNPSDVNSAKIAKKLKLPLYMFHGKKDELIGYEQAQNLFNNFDSKEKILHLDKMGTHHNILVTEYQFFKESGLFLLSRKIGKMK